MFALDALARSRPGLCRGYDVVILDRYVASNAAYAARLHENAAGKAAAWNSADPNLQDSGCPSPTGAPCGLCRARRERSRDMLSDPGRARDNYERDAELQRRTGAVYAELAAQGWSGRWLVVGADRSG